MVVSRTLLVVPLLTVCSGCFPESAPLVRQGEPDLPLSVELRDARGARYDAAEAPRDLTFALGFSERPMDDGSYLALFAGTLSPSLAPRLHAEAHRAALRAVALPLELMSHDTLLQARPTRALDAGAHYTLVWFGRESAAVQPLRASTHPDLGADFAESSPGAEERNVPRNVHAFVRFAGEIVAGAPSWVQLRDEHAELAISVHMVACSALGFPDGDCAWVVPAAPLAPRTHHQLSFDQTLRSATGATLAIAPIPFVTGDAADESPPSLTPLACGDDEQRVGALCVAASDRDLLLRGALDEPAVVTVALPPLQWSTISRAGEFTLHVPARAEPALLRLIDRAANVREEPLALMPATELADVLIDELRPDPLGREPTQEYVELVNAGQNEVALQGFSLGGDGRARVNEVVGALALAPGERALLVAPDFDLGERTDGELPSGARVVRLSSALALANGGGTVVLRDAVGRRLSTVSYRPALFEGQCSARGADHRTQRAATPLALDPDGGCTPGAATFPVP